MTKAFDFSLQAVADLASADVARALAEDLGAGDLTAALVAPGQRVRARVLARESAVIWLRISAACSNSSFSECAIMRASSCSSSSCVSPRSMASA